MGNLFTSSGIIGEAVTVSTKFWGISPSYSRWTPVSVSHKSNSSTLYYSEEKTIPGKVLIWFLKDRPSSPPKGRTTTVSQGNNPSGSHLHLVLINKVIDSQQFLRYEGKVWLDNHLLSCLATMICLSMLRSMVPLCVVYPCAIYVAIIFKALVDVVQSAHTIFRMNNLGGFVQFGQRMLRVNLI